MTIPARRYAVFIEVRVGEEEGCRTAAEAEAHVLGLLPAGTRARAHMVEDHTQNTQRPKQP